MTRSRCLAKSFGTCQSCSVPATSGHPVEAMPTVHRPDCEAHRRFGQITRSEVRPSAGGSGPFQKFTIGSSFSSTFSCGKCFARSGASAEYRFTVVGTVGKVRRGSCGDGDGWRPREPFEERTGSTRKFRLPDRRKSSSRWMPVSPTCVSLSHMAMPPKSAGWMPCWQRVLHSWRVGP